MSATATNPVLELRVGDVVEVRSEEEILRTLDSEACWTRFRSCRRCSSSAGSDSGSTSVQKKCVTQSTGER